MTWLWLVLGPLGGVLVLIVLIGSLLPKRFRSSASIRVSRPPTEVWAALKDAEQVPPTGSARKIERLPAKDGKPAWRADLGSTTIRVYTIEEDPPRRLVRELHDEKVPMRTRWEYEMAPSSGGTVVRVTEEGVIESGTWHVPFFRVINRVTRGAGVRAHLNALAKRFGDPQKAE